MRLAAIYHNIKISMKNTFFTQHEKFTEKVSRLFSKAHEKEPRPSMVKEKQRFNTGLIDKAKNLMSRVTSAFKSLYKLGEREDEKILRHHFKDENPYEIHEDLSNLWESMLENNNEDGFIGFVDDAEPIEDQNKPQELRFRWPALRHRKVAVMPTALRGSQTAFTAF